MEGLRIEHIERSKNDPDYVSIEFDIRDKKTDERYASVWGSELDDLQYDCDHPEHLLEYDEDTATCTICGATSLYNRGVEACGDGYDVDDMQMIDYDEIYEYIDWQYPSQPEGFIKHFIEEHIKKEKICEQEKKE